MILRLNITKIAEALLENCDAVSAVMCNFAIN